MGYTENYFTDDFCILTGRVGTLGTVRISQEKVWVSDNVIISKPKETELRYYSYFVLSRFDFKALNRGSTQPLITQTDLNNHSVLIPDAETLAIFHEQCKSLFSKQNQNFIENGLLIDLRNTLLPKLISGELEVFEQSKKNDHAEI